MSVTATAAEPHGQIAERIPTPQIWAPSRQLLNQSVPIPANDSMVMRKLLVSAERRQETTGMRKVWRAMRKEQDEKKAKFRLSTHSLPADRFTTQKLQADRPPKTIRYSSAPTYNSPVAKEQVYTLARPPSMTNSLAVVKDEPQQAKGTDRQTSAKDRKWASQSARPGSRNVYPHFGKNVHLPRIRINTLSADWWNEIKKKVPERVSYVEPVEAPTDRSYINRQIVGKFFMKNASQTYFQPTVPRYKETYVIHPEFDSEYQNCHDMLNKSSSRPNTVPVSVKA